MARFVAISWRDLERLSIGWSHPVDKKALQIQKLEHILVAQIYSI
jgi:hypothetical protein